MNNPATVNASIVMDYITGVANIPDTYYIGVTCSRKHGTNGKSVRYRSSGFCVVCVKINGQKKNKPKKADMQHKAAMEIQEEAVMLKELGIYGDTIGVGE